MVLLKFAYCHSISIASERFSLQGTVQCGAVWAGLKAAHIATVPNEDVARPPSAGSEWILPQFDHEGGW
jgi:hypothetical protein